MDPSRPGLYAITHYRRYAFERSHGTSSPEILLWNAAAGQPLLCFERVSHRPIWALGLWRRWKWREVPHGSARYDAEMRWAVEVYGLQRRQLGLEPF